MNKGRTLGTTRWSAVQKDLVAALFQFGVLMLGIVNVVLLVTYGVALNAPKPLSSVALLPMFALVIATTSVSGLRRGRRMRYNVLTPFAVGLVATTFAVGTTVFPGSAAWWGPAAMLSATPFFAIALLHRTEMEAAELGGSRS